MALTRADRISLHKKQERLSLKDGDIPDVSDLKEGIPVLRTNHEGVMEYIRHNNVLYKKSYTAVGEGGTESAMTAMARSTEFTPGTNQLLSKITAGTLERPNFDIDVVGDYTVNATEDIILHPGGNHIYFSTALVKTIDFDVDGSAGAGASIKLMSYSDTGDYFMIDTTTHGATEIKTVDDDATAAHLTFTIDGDIKFVPTGEVLVDYDTSDTTAGTYQGMEIKFDKAGASTSNNTMYGLTIDADNTTATSGTNTLTGMLCSATLTHAADAGTSTVYGGLFNATGNNAGSTHTSTAIGLWLNTSGADTNIGMAINQSTGTHLKLMKDANDYATFTVADTGDLTIATIGDGTTDSDLTLDVDGDITLDAAGDDINMIATGINIANFSATNGWRQYYIGDVNDYSQIKTTNQLQQTRIKKIQIL